jgi:hypothetical protein
MPRTLLMRTVSEFPRFLEASNSMIGKLNLLPLQPLLIHHSKCISSQPTESNPLFWDRTVCRTTTILLNRPPSHSMLHLPHKRPSQFMTIVIFLARIFQIMILFPIKSRLNRKPLSESLEGTKSPPMLSIPYRRSPCPHSIHSFHPTDSSVAPSHQTASPMIVFASTLVCCIF